METNKLAVIKAEQNFNKVSKACKKIKETMT